MLLGLMFSPMFSLEKLQVVANGAWGDNCGNQSEEEKQEKKVFISQICMAKRLILSRKKVV